MYCKTVKLIAVATTIAFSGTALGATHWIKADSETTQRANIVQWKIELDEDNSPIDLTGVDDQKNVIFNTKYSKSDAAWTASSLSDLYLLKLFLTASTLEARGFPKWLKALLGGIAIATVLLSPVGIALLTSGGGGGGKSALCPADCTLEQTTRLSPTSHVVEPYVVCHCSLGSALTMKCPNPCEPTEDSSSKTCYCAQSIVKGDSSDHEITRPMESPHGTTIHPK